MADDWSEFEEEKKPEPASRGQLNNVDHVRQVYFAEVSKLPEWELGLEMVRFCHMLKNLVPGTKLERKLNAAIQAIEVVE